MVPAAEESPVGAHCAEKVTMLLYRVHVLDVMFVMNVETVAV